VISHSDRAALLAIGLWATLAPIGSILGELPPFFVTGTGLLIGSLIAIFISGGKPSRLKVPPKTLLVGVYGLFGYHAALFAALQLAPAVQANLVNYLWPLLIVVLTPLFLSGTSLLPRHVIAALAGFAGAALAITSGGALSDGGLLGYLFALLAAIIWATYSLLTKRLPHFDSSAVGLFALVSGLLALVAHLVFETPVTPSITQWLLLIALGLGPLGGAFYLWDYALKNGDAQRIGLLSFLTPLLSTTLLLVVTGKELSWLLVVSGLLIVGAAVFGTRSWPKNG
jgi:drug/metabolite transporter (DMT)-like permease